MVALNVPRKACMKRAVNLPAKTIDKGSLFLSALAPRPIKASRDILTTDNIGAL